MGVEFQSNVSWGGSSHGDVSGLDFLNDSPPDSGGSGNGNNQDDQNNQTGETGGHKLLDQYNKLVAEGKGGTTQAQELGRYLGRVEQKKQAEGESLYGDVYGPELHKPTLSSEDIVNQLAALEAGDPFDPENRYVKSFQGEQFRDYWLNPEKRKDYYGGVEGGLSRDDPRLQKEWIKEFGMPSIVSTQGWGTPTLTTERTDEFGNKLGGEYIYTGLGKSLMDQFEGSVAGTQLFGGDLETYQQEKDQYWSDRTAAESATNQGQPPSWGGGGGGGGGGGYYGDPRTGNPIDRYGNFYTPQANLQQAMVNVHGTPTVFKKRGGIVSLLGLGS